MGKTGLGAIVCKTAHVRFRRRKWVLTRLCSKNRKQGHTRQNRGCFGWGWYHYPRRALRVAETLDDRLSKWFICRFLASPMQFLAEAMDSAIHAGLGDKYYELQVEFHNVYLDLCPNTEMTDLLKRLENNFIRNYYLFENPDNENSVLEETNQQHYEIIRLFREKKPAELAQYIRDVHWDSSKAKFDSLPSQHM